MAPLLYTTIPPVEAVGRKAPSSLLNSDRGSAIPIPTQSPLTGSQAVKVRNMSLRAYMSRIRASVI